ncbi:hypothetical protein HDU87_005674 [Geranomyces variabilis]|uniref:Photolyase/cryptochrome alpha/beta domain-containing protein n=1 Tax=Geranomyces variabilis TaxID=109894 RepID=A0AAD5TGG6_9FUNG|nr:hypothetical protein HDU87_005674 [Geranomyces variabilis]
MPPVRVLYWFRTDLRLTDSPAVKAALDLAPSALYPVWCWDPEYVYSHNVGVNRFQFLLDSMNDTSAALTRLNPKSQLFVIRGSPRTLLKDLLLKWEISHLVFEEDKSAYGRVRDASVSATAASAGVKVVTRTGHTLWDTEAIVAKNGGHPTLTSETLMKCVDKLPNLEPPIPAPNSIPPPGPLDLALDRNYHPVSRPVDRNARDRTAEVTVYDTFTGPHADFAVPTLEELGMPPATTPYRGGEAEGLKRLEAFCSNEIAVAKFEKPKTSPAAFLPPQTTLMSPYLKFGCVSVRYFHKRVQDIIAKHKRGSSGLPVNLPGQLYFREMYYAAEFATPCFDRIRGNPICRYINWSLENVYDADGALVVPRPVSDDAEAEMYFERWKEGRTGFPWIDALMRQLKHDGWIHHLGRHSVACFLTRGHCFVSWERGLEVFDQWLIDWDPCSNPGNWMWLSCSAFFHSYFRVYSPIAFGKKWDKHGDLIRQYVPELKNFPAAHIYEPWKCPIADQRKAGCIIGKNYPKPMFDEKARKEHCLERMKAAFALGLKGDDTKVLDGSARRELDEADAATVIKSAATSPVSGAKRKQASVADMFAAKGGGGGSGSSSSSAEKMQKISAAADQAKSRSGGSRALDTKEGGNEALGDM